MKNKVKLKKYLIICTIIFLIYIITNCILTQMQYKQCTKNVNGVINQIVAKIQEKYPNIETIEIVQILNSDEVNASNILLEYGINIEKDSVILKNDLDHTKFLLINIAVTLLLFMCIILVFAVYKKNQKKKIDEITKYIEKINNKNYALDIQDNSEDELSILKNELYKITVMLKEQAENSKNDKISLKKSLEDISHQLKTPLSSITIMLDNILDNPNMNVKTRNEFIKDISKEITKINFLVQSLLKLSKFDVNTITFNDKQEKIRDIIEEAIENVSTLCDLKNIEIVTVAKSEIIETKPIPSGTDVNINDSNEEHRGTRNIQNSKQVANISNLKKERLRPIKQYQQEKKSMIDKNNLKYKTPTVVCDLKWQVEAITNILKNSVEHSKENSKIYINYDENNMYSEIIIKDNGIGIEKSDIKHIFERFYKGKNSSKDSVRNWTCSCKNNCRKG